MKKIGIILDQLVCTRYVYEVITTLQKDPRIEPIIMYNQIVHSQQTSLAKKVLHYIINSEQKLFSYLSADIKEECKTYNLALLEDLTIISLSPAYNSGEMSITYHQRDQEEIASLKLDLIFQADQNIVIIDGAYLAKDGMILSTYSDTSWNRSHIDGFWEVYLRKSSIGFSIHHIKDQEYYQNRIYHGNVAIERTITQSKYKIYRESLPYIKKVLIDYAHTSQLPLAQTGTPFADTNYKIPSIFQSLAYLFKTVGLFFYLIFNRKLLKNESRWSVAFIPSHWQSADLGKGIEIKSPATRFFADPFVVTRERRTVCYLEDYDYHKNTACISAVEIYQDDSYQILGPVIEEPFHMSFPYLLEFDGELYMIPETHQSKSIRLYKCIDYPLQWEYQKDIMSDCSAADTMIFPYNDKWWMLTNMATEGNSDQAAQLFAFYSDHPFSNRWHPHVLNPLIFDSDLGRNAGLVYMQDNTPVRVRQKQDFNMYGDSFSIAKITDLSEDSYKELTLAHIYPNFSKKIRGTHHMHSNKNYTVYDYMRNEKII